MTTDNLKPLRVVCRIEKATKAAIIVYRDSTARNGLTGYTIAEQHCELHPAYYRANTRPAKTPEEQAACEALIIHYAVIAERHGGERLIIGSRLCC